jgi:hypothetical protein
MPDYVYSARSPTGERTTGRSTAANAAAARAALQAQGFGDIVIHTDEFEAQVGGTYTEGVPRTLDPAALIQARQRGGLRDLLWRVLRAHGITLAVLVGWNAYSLMRHDVLGFVDWLGFAIMLIVVVVIIGTALPAALFETLLAAQLWARWVEAERCVALLRLLRRGPRLASHMLDYYHAKNLIGSGKIHEGLSLFEPHVSSGRAPQVLTLSLKASLLDAAKRRKEAGQLMKRVTQLVPESAQAWLDVALNQALHGEVSEAKAALDEAQARILNPIMAAVVPFIHGQIAYRETHYDAAARCFQEALGGLAPFVQQTALAPLLMLVQARYAIALACAHRRESAQRAWAVVSPLLNARGEKEIIAEWERCTATGLNSV